MLETPASPPPVDLSRPVQPPSATLPDPLLPPPRRSHFSKHPVFTLFLLLVLSLAAALSLYLLVQMRSMALSKIEPSPTPLPTSTPDPTASWKTYTDPSLALEFKYPADLSFEDLGNTVISFADSHGKVKFNLTGFQTLNLVDYQKYLKAETASNNLRHLTSFQDQRGRTWETDLVLAEVFNFTAILSQQGHYHILSLQSDYGEEGDNGESFRAFANQLLATVKILNCSSNAALNLTLIVPPNWECTGLADESDYGGISLRSPDFQIELSDGGRGPYCGDGEDLEELCKTEVLDLSQDWSFTVFNFQGEDKEIFGGLGQTSRDTNRWISIKYNGMETKKLTNAQKQELLKFLNSIKFTN